MGVNRRAAVPVSHALHQAVTYWHPVSIGGPEKWCILCFELSYSIGVPFLVLGCIMASFELQWAAQWVYH